MNIRDRVGQVFGRGGDNGSAQDAPDALSLIHGDHEEVSALFERALGDGARASERRSLATRICDALTLHARMEEALFYPALRRAGGQDEKDSVLEAAEEHGVVKDLIAKIQATRAGDETLKAKLTVLKELVQHHVREEESTIFSEARRTLGDQLDELGAEMQAFKSSGGRTRGGRSTGSTRKASTRKTAARKTGAHKTTAPKTAARKTATTRKTTRPAAAKKRTAPTRKRKR